MLCRAIGLPLYLALTSGEPKQDATRLQLTRGRVHNSPHLLQLILWQGAHSADASVPGSHEEECGITQMTSRKPRGRVWNRTDDFQEAMGKSVELHR